MRWKDIPQFPQAHYNVHVSWKYLEESLDRYAETWVDTKTGERHGGLNLSPDYQRAHVWTREQQIAYVEYMLQGGEVGRNIIFNCPTWMNSFKDPLELVDGKQRLEAVLQFIWGNNPAFGVYYNDFEGPMGFDHYFNFQVCQMKTREEILQLYLNINAGGTPHTKEELDKVRKMLAELDKSK